MLYLNTRHALPRIGIRQQTSTLDSHAIQPKPEATGYRPARSNLHATMPQIDIDSYPSRHAYGARTMRDFTSDCGKKGQEDIGKTTSGHAQTAWAMIDNAAKPGHDEVASQAHNELARKVRQQRYLVIQPIPRPAISVTLGDVAGTPDEGNTKIKINTEPFAAVKFHRGYCETYIKQKGFIENYVTEGHYDTYA